MGGKGVRITGIIAVACCLVLALLAFVGGPAFESAQVAGALPTVAGADAAAWAEGHLAQEGQALDVASSAVGPQANEAKSDGSTAAWPSDAQRVPGEVLVSLGEGCSAADVLGGVAGCGFDGMDGLACEDVALGWAKVTLPPGIDEDAAIDKLKASGLIEDAQPNFVYHIMDDVQMSGASGGVTLAGSVKAMADAGRVDALAAGAFQIQTQASETDELASLNQWWMNTLGLETAWEAQPTSSGVTVAIIDTGCLASHEDLADANFAYCYNAITGASGKAAVADVDGHGTHVTGLIAAVPDNGVGIAGVARDAKLMIVKAVDKKTSSTDLLLKAYNYVMKRAKTDASIRIVNMSLGAASGYDPALLRAIDKAYYEYGILSVFAAGNDDTTVPYYCFPCDYAEVGLGVMNVGRSTSTSLRGSVDSSSNRNVGSEKTKDICAPGVSIVSTYPASLGGVVAGVLGYSALTGTSMSAPIATGVAALALAANPALTAGQLKSLLCSTAADIRRSDGSGVGFDAYTGYGLVRASEAVANASSGYLRGRDAVRVGKTITLAVPQTGSWTWSASPTSVATVSSSGVVKGVSAGEAVISAINTATKQKLSKTVVVYKRSIVGASSVKAGKKLKLALSCTPLSMCTWTSSDTSVATVGATSGVVKAKKVGTTTIKATLTAAPTISVSKKIKVVKGTNPLTVKAKTKSVAYAKLKKKAQKVKGSIVFTKAGKGAVRYTRVAGLSSARLSVNKKTGVITVKKGTPRGTYTMCVKVRAAGNNSYKARTRTVTVKVKVV